MDFQVDLFLRSQHGLTCPRLLRYRSVYSVLRDTAGNNLGPRTKPKVTQTRLQLGAASPFKYRYRSTHMRLLSLVTTDILSTPEHLQATDGRELDGDGGLKPCHTQNQIATKTINRWTSFLFADAIMTSTCRANQQPPGLQWAYPKWMAYQRSYAQGGWFFYPLPAWHPDPCKCARNDALSGEQLVSWPVIPVEHHPRSMTKSEN